MRNTKLASGLCDWNRPRVPEVLKTADWGEQNGQPKPMSKPVDTCIHLTDISQNTRAQGQPIDGPAVASQSGFCFGPANDVMPGMVAEV
jgi:hypothetical protein